MSLATGVMGMIEMGVSAMGTATQSYAAHQQAKADNLAAQWNAGVMENNALLKDIQANQALERGQHDVALAKMEGGLLLERQRASYAASGVKVDSGSALDVVAEQAGKNKYDQDMLKYNAELNAWGIRGEANNLRQQAMMTRATGRSPGLAAATTMLGGATSLFNQYNNYPMFAK